MDPARSPWLLRAMGAGKSFGQTHALIDANLTIDPGEAVAIMGPSGSGKSTLLHVLAGIIPADSGNVILRRPRGGDLDDDAIGDGVFDGGVFEGGAFEGGVFEGGVFEGGAFDDIATLTDGERSSFRLRRFGFVFQQGMLLPELTAAENVGLPLLIIGRSRGEARARAEVELQRLGLAGLGDRRIGQLSGGQAQRVAVARALVTGPSLIFADEPTGALDSRTADEVLEALLAASRGADRALMMVTHDEHVASRCDRIVRLRDGRIEVHA